MNYIPRIDRRSFVIGSAVGVPLGVALLARVPPNGLRAAIGVVLIGFSLYTLARPKLPPMTCGGKIADGAVGALGGVVGGASGLAGLITILWCALRGWPRERAPFSLGRWGLPVNVLALIGAGLTCVNLLWPRDSTNPVFKADIRVAYWLVGIPLVVGIVYYVVFQHRQLAQPIEEPDEEQVTATA